MKKKEMEGHKVKSRIQMQIGTKVVSEKITRLY